MKPNLFVVLVLIAIAFGPGCCPMLSEHPLSNTPDVDLPLEGVWKFDSPEKEDINLHIYKTANGHFVLHSIEQKEGGQTETFTVPFYPTQIGDAAYANVDIGKALDQSFGADGGYFFVKIIQLDNETLQVTTVAQAPIQSAIKAGRLRGDIQKRGAPGKPESEGKVCYLPQMAVTCVRITDTTENLRRFILSSPPESLFTDTLRFRRIR